MKIKKIGILIATLATTSPLSMADVKKNSDQNESTNVFFSWHGKTLLNTFDRVQGWGILEKKSLNN